MLLMPTSIHKQTHAEMLRIAEAGALTASLPFVSHSLSMCFATSWEGSRAKWLSGLVGLNGLGLEGFHVGL